MKLKLIALGVSTAAMMAVPMTASAADASLQFSGERAVVCEVSFDQTGVNFDQLGNKGQAAKKSVKGNVFCNQPSNVSFQSDNGYLQLIGMTANLPNDPAEVDMESASNPGFNAGVDYTATIPSVGGLTADTSLLLAGTAAALPGTVPALNQNNVKIVFDTIAGSQPLLGGAYADKLTVTITPAGV